VNFGGFARALCADAAAQASRKLADQVGIHSPAAFISMVIQDVSPANRSTTTRTLRLSCVQQDLYQQNKFFVAVSAIRNIFVNDLKSATAGICTS
jgi:hypothetical protein